MQKKFIIFDMDDTLVNFLEYYRVAFKETFREIYGIQSNLDEIDFAGKTIPNIIKEMGNLKGINEKVVEDKLERALESIAEKFLKCLNKTNYISFRNVLPGAKELLNELNSLGYPLGLLTGSTSKVAKKILEITDLGKYFDVLTFGEEANSREELFKLSIKKVEKKFSLKFRGKDVVVIGDSIRDVSCGKIFSALTIAVVTGRHSYDELNIHKPDYILYNLKDYNRIISLISKV